MRIDPRDRVSSEALAGERVAVIGYGSQGRAHALNIHDGHGNVVVGLREGGPSARNARADGLKTCGIRDAVAGATFVAMLTPDLTHKTLWEEEIAPNLAPGAAVLFAHGFSVHYQALAFPDSVDAVLVAPKGPGDLVRREFVLGRGVPCLFAVHQDATGRARDRAVAYARAIGGAQTGLIETTFAEETETDLFGEQAVLCGGATELVIAGYETLVAAGYQPEVAYFECMHELKLIVDLLYEGGLRKMHAFVSETAKYGDLVSGPRVVNSETRARMAEVLADIRSGAFAREWIAETGRGRPRYRELLEKDLAHPIEVTGEALRKRMAWLKSP